MINTEGVVRNSSGKKLGTIRNDKIVNDNGATIYKYDGGGTIRDRNVKMLYRIGSNDIRNSSGRSIIKYKDIDLNYLIGYLCFFQKSKDYSST